jgi:hypothetical protein
MAATTSSRPFSTATKLPGASRLVRVVLIALAGVALCGEDAHADVKPITVKSVSPSDGATMPESATMS